MVELSIVIPVYNEVETIEDLISRVQAVQIEKEIIVVDDFSTDGTRELLGRLDRQSVKVLFHDRNRGKGAALRTGFKAVSGRYVIVQDADLEYNPAEYPKLLQPLADDLADVVYGSRFVQGESPHRVARFWHSLGNQVLTGLSNILNDIRLTDMETCYKAFRQEVIGRLNLKENRFGIEPEITAKIARQKLRVYEVGISYNARSNLEGKKIGWGDAFEAVWCMIRYRFGD